MRNASRVSVHATELAKDDSYKSTSSQHPKNSIKEFSEGHIILMIQIWNNVCLKSYSIKLKRVIFRPFASDGHFN